MSSGLDRRAKCYNWLLKTSKDHRLRDLKQKGKIIRGARRIKPLEFLLMKNWHKKPLTREKSSVPSLKKREQKGKIAYFVLDRLVIKDRLERPS